MSVVFHLAVFSQCYGRRLPAGDPDHRLAQHSAHRLPGERLVACTARTHLAIFVEAPGKHLVARGHVTKRLQCEPFFEMSNFDLTIVSNVQTSTERARAAQPIKTMTGGAKFFFDYNVDLGVDPISGPLRWN